MELVVVLEDDWDILDGIGTGAEAVITGRVEELPALLLLPRRKKRLFCVEVVPVTTDAAEFAIVGIEDIVLPCWCWPLFPIVTRFPNKPRRLIRGLVSLEIAPELSPTRFEADCVMMDSALDGAVWIAK